MKEFYFKKKIYYRKNDFKTNLKTLVFIHGISGSSSAWLNYEKALENKYNILVFDIRGHGKSKKYSKYSDYQIKYFVNDFYELITFLEINKFILISHSYATLIASAFINKYAEKVEANIFLSPVLGIEKKIISKFINLILKFSYFLQFLPFKERFGGHVDYTKYKNSRDWTLNRCYADLKNTDLRVYFYGLENFLSGKNNYFLDKISMPTLIVHGEKDTIIPVKNSIELSRKIKNAELKIIPNADHIIVLNNSEDILVILNLFLKEIL